MSEQPAVQGHIAALSIIVPDAGRAARQVADHFGWPLGEFVDVNFADVHAPGVDLWFSTSAAQPMGRIDGLTIHVFVDDVDTAADAVVARGGSLIEGPVDRDFGMRSALFQGPGALVIDLTCML